MNFGGLSKIEGEVEDLLECILLISPSKFGIGNCLEGMLEVALICLAWLAGQILFLHATGPHKQREGSLVPPEEI